MSYLLYLCLFAHGGAQHLLCNVFVLFVFALCVLCCPFLLQTKEMMMIIFNNIFIKSI
jgi:hypothetical protein